MITNDIFMDLITGDDIKFQGIIIHPPTFREIKEIGINVYEQIMLPYSLTLDYFSESIDTENVNLYEDILLKDQSFVSCLAYSLQLLTKAKDIVLYSKHIELVFESNNERNKSFSITKDNFDEFSEIILKINANKKIEVEKPPKNMTERQKDVWEKLQAGRKNDTKKNEVLLFDILNLCEFAGNYHIPISEIMNWTLWRIMNCYKAILNIRIYDDNLKICLVSGNSKNISGDNHWYKQLMIRE